MSEREKHYWGFRIDTRRSDFFWDELRSGHLRIGWGYDKEQNLKTREQYPEYWKSGAGGAGSNVKIIMSVKKGDILLVPRIPDWDKVTIVQARKDFFEGYKFDFPNDEGDYAHIFPADVKRTFSRSNNHVSGGIRTTLKARCRFWNLNPYGDDIEKILNTTDDVDELGSDTDKLGIAVNSAFHEFSKKFQEDVCDKINRAISAKGWEYVLIDVLSTIFPQYEFKGTGGKTEKEHGTDILMTIPTLKTSVPVGESEVGEFEYGAYGIAIQVKDYVGEVGSDVIDQIGKANEYWKGEGIKIIENVVIVTKAEREQNIQLIQNESGVKFIFADRLNEMLFQYAKKYIGKDEE